jgi:hypothetical protein
VFRAECSVVETFRHRDLRWICVFQLTSSEIVTEAIDSYLPHRHLYIYTSA